MEQLIREMKGRQTAFELLALAMAKTHPEPAALLAIFREQSEFMRTYLLNQPLSEAYLERFDAACAQIAAQLEAS